MAVDTRNKRSSAVDVSSPWRTAMPAPNSTIDAQDRAHIAGYYALSEAISEGIVITARGRLAILGALKGF